MSYKSANGHLCEILVPTHGKMIMLSKASDSGETAEPWGELVSYLSNNTGTEKLFKKKINK